MALVTFAGDSTPSPVDLDANFVAQRFVVSAHEPSFGVAGDYSPGGGTGTDDTIGLQAALDAAGSRVSPPTMTLWGSLVNAPQGEVVLGKGKNYKLTAQLIVPPGVVLNLNGSTLWQTTAAANGVSLLYQGLGYSFYGHWFGGVVNGVLQGIGSGTSTGIGLNLDVVNKGKVENLRIRGFKYGRVSREVQYTEFRNVTCDANKVGSYSTARSNATDLASIDNIYINCIDVFNEYGSWDQCESSSTHHKWECSRNTVADLVVGALPFGQLRSFTVSAGGSGYTASATLPVTITDSNAASFTAWISGTVMTVTASSSGTIAVNAFIQGSNVIPGTKVVSLGTGTGGTGTYNLSISQTVADSVTPVALTAGGLYAQAYAETSAGGVVTGVFAVDAGLGYSTPVVSVPGGTTGATVTTTPVTDAYGEWTGCSATSRGGNIYHLKSEHTGKVSAPASDDTPSSGYAVMILGDQIRQNRFLAPNFQRQGDGNRKYFRWLFNGGRGNIIDMPNNSSDAPDAVTNPAVAGDVSVCRSVKVQGLFIIWGPFLAGQKMHTYTVGAGSTPDYSGLVGSVGMHTYNGGWAAKSFGAQNSTAAELAFEALQTGDTVRRLQITCDGGYLMGSGSATPDAGFERKAANVFGPQAGDSFQVGGVANETLKYNAGTTNGTVATTLGSVGPTGATAGNPQGWLRVNVAGTDRFVPYW